MKRPTRAQQAEWSAKLEATGFDDLESTSGALSNRGLPTWGDDGRHLTADGLAQHETHQENAREVARSHRFATRLDRRIWTLWADGVETGTGRQREEIARQVGVSTRQVRQSLWRTRAAVEREARDEVSPVNPVKARDRKKVERLVRSADPGLLLAVALRFA